jgi:Flp pilus assembly protein TadD
VLLFVPVLGACLAAGCASEEKFAGPSSVFADVEDFDASGDKPPRAKTLHALARILADRGQENQSRYVLARAIKEEPRYLPAYTELAEIYVRNGRLNDAVTVLSTGLKEAPGDPVLLNDLGMCALLKGDSEKALEHFSQAAAAVPGDAKYRANMALAAGMMGRYADALSIYKELLPAEDAHYNLAVICEARNDAERAALEYQLAEAEE